MWQFDHKYQFPIADIDNRDYLLMLGVNPPAPNSIWTVRDVKKHIKVPKSRDGKLVVIDPCHT